VSQAQVTETIHPSHNCQHPTSSKTNQLLAALPPADYERLMPHLKPHNMAAGHVLYQVREPIQRVYFLTGGMVSLVLTSEEGTDVEVGVIDSEGVVGGGAALTDSTSIHHTVMQIGGSSVYLPAAIFKAEFQRGGALQDLVLRHWQFLSVQASQCVLCNRLHSVEERLARWLLMVHDRVRRDEIDLTQEFLGDMLGSRRAGVTVAAGILRAGGMIDYKRGQIFILDRKKLEDTACACYREIYDQGRQLLHWKRPD